MFLKSLLTIILYLLSLTVYSQNSSKNIFFNEIKIDSDKYIKEPNFKKIQQSFLNKNWDSTLLYSFKELNISKKSSNIKDYYYFFRGYSFQKKKLLEESKKEYLKIKKEFTFYNHIIAYIGEIALEQRNFNKAIRCFLKVDSINKKYKLQVNKVNIFHNIGIGYMHLKSFEQAESYLKQSLENNIDTLKLIRFTGNLASLYYEQYKDDIAISYFKKAYQLAKTVTNFELKQNTAKNMAVVEENRKDLTKALKYRKEYERWRDSLNNQNNIWKTAQLEKKFAVQQKQQEVNVLTAENRANIAERNGFLFSSGVLAILLFTGAFFYREKLKSNKIISNQNKRLDELNETKNRLFSIVSHDLRSTITTLKLSNKKLLKNVERKDISITYKLLKENSNTVNNAYSLLDNLLNWALLQTKQAYFEIKKILLCTAVEHVAYNYKSLLNDKELNLENNIELSLEVMADQESLKIILRNLLDNAIKFSKLKGSIKFYTRNLEENYVTLIVEDTGLGMDDNTRVKLQNSTTLTVNEREHQHIKGSGLGLQLCKSMIQKNNGKFLIESELGKGTKMIVSLPKATY